MVLVDAGGLGKEVSIALRAASLPGSEYVLPLLFSTPLLRAGGAVAGVLGKVGLQAGPDVEEIARGIATFSDVGTRTAFVHTVRSVIDPAGQRVSARDRLYLAEGMPTMIVWGERDPIIPIEHGHAAAELIGDCRMEVFPGAGHFPHRDDPLRFAGVLRDFLETTEPAHITEDVARRLLQERAAA
jgi:pimeloyl-ACP methyl ester carboxylesterase